MNMGEILKAAGGGYENGENSCILFIVYLFIYLFFAHSLILFLFSAVVKTTVLLADMNDFTKVNDVYKQCKFDGLGFLLVSCHFDSDHLSSETCHNTSYVTSRAKVHCLSRTIRIFPLGVSTVQMTCINHECLLYWLLSSETQILSGLIFTSNELLIFSIVAIDEHHQFFERLHKVLSHFWLLSFFFIMKFGKVKKAYFSSSTC